MEWRDTGIVLGARSLGESSRIVEILTRDNGRSAGLVRGARSARMRVALQPGNVVAVAWRARLDDHLGTFTIELVQAHAGRLMETAHGTFAMQSIAALMRALPERDPHVRIYEGLRTLIEHMDDPRLAGEGLVRFELLLLEEFGFGLDLSACAATGVTEDLGYVSPRSGRAVSRAAAGPYRDRLLPLPPFLSVEPGIDPTAGPNVEEMFDGFRLTGHFLEAHVIAMAGRPMPAVRGYFLDALRRALLPALAVPLDERQ